MDWSKGFTYKIYARIVDSASWTDREYINVLDGDIAKTDSDLRESATITVRDYIGEQWIRVYMDCEQNGDSYHAALFTGLATSPSKEIDGTVQTIKLQCYSVLKPLDDVLLPRGWYAQAYREPSRILDELLAPCFAPVEYGDDLHQLTQHLVAEENESNLTMLNKILRALNLTLRIDGSGKIKIDVSSTEPLATFTPNGYDIIEPQLTYRNDWYSCPNVLMAISEELMAIARDDAEDSPLSTINRGREIWLEDDSVDLADNETLAEYAKRRLREEQMTVESLEYKRRYIPDINVGDIVQLRYPDFAGIYKIMSQKYGMDGSVSEEVARL